MNFTSVKLSELAGEIGKGLSLKDRLVMRYRPRICPFHKLMEFVPGNGKLLDVGCGSGLWIYLLYRSGLLDSALGVDVVDKVIAKANSLKFDDESLEFRVYDGFDFPLEKFDCVSLIDVLHHVPTDYQSEFIKKICGIDTELIIFKDIDPTAKFKTMMNSLHDIVCSGQLPIYCRKSEVSTWFKECGFEVVESDRCDMLWYSHYYIVAKRT